MAGEKDLSLLTIDGTTFRNLFTDKNIGKYSDARWSGSQNIPANARTAVGNSVTLDKAGIYMVVVSVVMGGSTTGNNMRSIGADVNGSVFISDTLMLPINQFQRITLCAIGVFEDNAVIGASVIPFGAAQTCTSTFVACIKLPVYPGIEE